MFPTDATSLDFFLFMCAVFCLIAVGFSLIEIFAIWGALFTLRKLYLIDQEWKGMTNEDR